MSQNFLFTEKVQARCHFQEPQWWSCGGHSDGGDQISSWIPLTWGLVGSRALVGIVKDTENEVSPGPGRFQRFQLG